MKEELCPWCHSSVKDAGEATSHRRVIRLFECEGCGSILEECQLVELEPFGEEQCAYSS